MLNAKVKSILEFDKIVRQLVEFAATSLGKELASEASPSADLEEVKLRLKGTDEAAAAERLKGPPPFGGIRNIRASLHRARIGALLNAAELLDIGTTTGGGRKVKRYVAALGETLPLTILSTLAEQIEELKPLEEEIARCIDDNAEVADAASPGLASVRRELRTGEARVRERLEQMVRTPSVQKMLQDVLVTMRGDRYVLPVKSEYRSSFGGIVHDQSSSGATLFIEPEAVVALNNRLRELKAQELREIEKVLAALTEQVAAVALELAANVDLLAQIDFAFAKAGYARSLKATLPMMNDRGFMKLKRGRHPLIAREHVVPLDVELGNAYSAIIVTGPNTGGKTVTLKTVGLLSLMAMTGLFVPAEDGSQMCVFDAVYADIGDEQSIEQSLSTFSSHLTNIISILREMTPKSLVLLDEVGAGTDPAEGSALAIALLEHILATGCRMIATTHYKELKAYAYERKGVINASMEFDVATLSPTYRLLVGVPGRSNAFAIAERLGLPKPIIDRARGEVGEDDQRVESMIASLERNRLGAEAEFLEAEKHRREAEELRVKLQSELGKLEQERSRMLEKAEREAADAVAKARKEAEDIIADLRKLAMEEGASVKEHKLIAARKKLEEAAPKLRTGSSVGGGAKRTAAVVGPGDEVKVISFNQKGYIVDEPKNGEVTVQMGIIKTKVKLTDVEPIQAAGGGGGASGGRKQQPTGAGLKRTRDDNIRMELDLRGANLEEAIVEVDRFLDESFLSNLGQVYIIHGKGTGVLRAGIQEYLRKHKHVKSYRLGNYGEGGVGVTIAELK